jgi:hypothetical protein
MLSFPIIDSANILQGLAATNETKCQTLMQCFLTVTYDAFSNG